MKIVYIYATIYTLIIAIILLIMLLLHSFNTRKKEKYIFDLSNKFDNFTDINKITYIIADEIKKIIKAEFVAIIKYTYNNIEILSSIPTKYTNKDLSDVHEIFIVLKNLQNNYKTIRNDEIKNKNIRNYFPIFNYENYHILSMYNDNNTIITLEIYGKIKKPLILKKKIIDNIIEIFQKTYIQKIKFNKEIFKTQKNETIIKFLDRIRNTLDENEIEKQVLQQIAEVFKADRAYFLHTGKNITNKPFLGLEYLGNPYVKSLRDMDIDINTDEVWQQIKSINTTSPVFVIENSDKFLSRNNLKGTPLEIFIKKSQIKSSYPFIIYEDERTAIYLLIQFTGKAVIFDKNDFEILELLTKQI